MVTQLITVDAINNKTPDWRIPFNTEFSQWHLLSTGIVVNVTIPDKITVVRFGGNVSFVCSPDIISSPPSLGSPLSGTYEPNPSVRVVVPSSTLSIYPLDDGMLVLNFYKE